MHCTYCGMPKGMCSAEAISNSEKINPVALAIIELYLSDSISHSFNRKFHLILLFFKFRSNLLKMFRVDQKACLGLVCALSSSGKSEAGFWVMFCHGPCLHLCGPYYTVLSYCMMTSLLFLVPRSYSLYNATCYDLGVYAHALFAYLLLKSPNSTD